MSSNIACHSLSIIAPAVSVIWRFHMFSLLPCIAGDHGVMGIFPALIDAQQLTLN